MGCKVHAGERGNGLGPHPPKEEKEPSTVGTVGRAESSRFLDSWSEFFRRKSMEREGQKRSRRRKERPSREERQRKPRQYRLSVGLGSHPAEAQAAAPRQAGQSGPGLPWPTVTV